MGNKNNNGVTFDMIRAFVCLSECLNVSEATRRLGATRQTVHRHIGDLQGILGINLFEVKDRQYLLTSAGEDYLPEARSLLISVDSWSGRTPLKRNSKDGLQLLQFTDGDGRRFLSQQHSISEIALNGLPLMRQAFTAWGQSLSQIEHPAMAAIKPYLVLFRQGPSGWYFVHVGDKSAYEKWFGWKWSRSAIGKLISEDHLSDEYNEFSLGAYARIYREGGIRLDHVLAHLPQADGHTEPGTFQRLLLGGAFPDGTPGLILMSVITESVKIDAMTDDLRPIMSPEVIMDLSQVEVSGQHVH